MTGISRDEIENAWKVNEYLTDENKRLRTELARARRYNEIVKKTTEDVSTTDVCEVVMAAAKLVRAGGYRVVYGE